MLGSKELTVYPGIEHVSPATYWNIYEDCQTELMSEV